MRVFKLYVKLWAFSCIQMDYRIILTASIWSRFTNLVGYPASRVGLLEGHGRVTHKKAQSKNEMSS